MPYWILDMTVCKLLKVDIMLPCIDHKFDLHKQHKNTDLYVNVGLTGYIPGFCCNP